MTSPDHDHDSTHEHSDHEGPHGAHCAKPKRTRNKNACSACRQSKLKCDARVHFPKGCTRCNKAGLTCNFDPHFRRIPKRKMAQQAALGHTVGAASSSSRVPILPPIGIHPMPAKVHADDSHSPASTHSDPHTPSRAESTTVASPLLLSSRSFVPHSMPHASEIAPRSLPVRGQANHFHLTSDQIYTLFDTFFERLHPHLPIILTTRDPNTIYAESPFLFWTICATAGRVAEPWPVSTNGIFWTIGLEVREMAGKLLVDAAKSVRSVQALLILIYWHLPNDAAQSHDEWTHLYSGVSTHLAMSLGLHRPTHEADFSDKESFTPEQVAERTQTWIFCFCFDRMLSANKGTPVTVREDWAILSASNQTPSPLMPDVQKFLRIQLFSGRIAESLGGSTTTSTGLVEAGAREILLRLFHSQLTDLGRQLDPMSSTIRVYYLATVLQLHTYALHDDFSQRLQLDMADSVQHCFTSAVRLIDCVSDMAEDRHAQTLKYLPIAIPRAVSLATAFLFKLTSLPHAPALNTESALNAISKAYAVCMEMSACVGDLPYRAAAVFAQQSTIAMSNNPSQVQSSGGLTSLRVRTRMGASLVYDALWSLKKGVVRRDRDRERERSGTRVPAEQRSSVSGPAETNASSATGIAANSQMAPLPVAVPVAAQDPSQALGLFAPNIRSPDTAPSQLPDDSPSTLNAPLAQDGMMMNGMESPGLPNMANEDNGYMLETEPFMDSLSWAGLMPGFDWNSTLGMSAMGDGMTGNGSRMFGF